MKFTRRSILLGTAGFAGASILNHASSFAQTAGAQSYANLKFGDANVIALSDGALSLKLEMYANADKTEAMQLLEAANLNADGIASALNAYIVQVSGKTVLIDTGHNSAIAKTAGKLSEHLKLAGIDAAKIDIVLLTHAHPDHVGGLTTNGVANFPNAVLMIAESEYNFWFDDGILSNAPLLMKGAFNLVRNALAPYDAAKKIEKFTAGNQIISGITSISAAGHTPGHTMYRIGNGKDSLLIWGDIVHTPALQFAHPEWAISFDVDKAMAVETRKKIFDMAASDALNIAGMHIPFAGIGKVQKQGNGYKFIAKV